MAFNQRRTYLCYNNKDLIRDGFIPPFIRKEYLPPDTFNLNRAKRPRKGISYKIVRDENGQVLSVTETKKLLPANKIMLEIDFSKVMKSAIKMPFKPGSLAFTPLMGTVGPFMFSPIGFGGIAEGITEMTYQLLDADTKINKKVIVTKKIIDDGVIVDDGFPLSIFGIAKEVEIEEEITKEDGSTETVKRLVRGLDFTSDQLKILGKYSDGVWKGTRRKRISGATDSNGTYGSIGIPDLTFDDVKKGDQKQLFIQVVWDNRRLKFRGDNFDSDGGRAYPFRITGRPKLDATDKQIRIDTTDLKVGDNIYITYSVASRRRIRQTLTHLGRIAQGSTIGIVGFRGAIKSESDVFDFKIKTWAVPKLPPSFKISEIDTIGDIYTDDSQYKLTPEQYIRMRRKEVNLQDYNRSIHVENLQGWRLGEAITNEVKRFWVADYRGIFLYDDGKMIPVLDRSLIRDRDWFTSYLMSLEFTTPTGSIDPKTGENTYTSDDLAKNIDDNIEWRDTSGHLFDLSEINNSLLFDREKIPYYRPFAKALKEVSNWVIDNTNSGVGIMNLDLYDKLDPGFQDPELFDLSYAEFDLTNSQPTLISECKEPFDIFPHHYFSQSYDTSTDAGGVGAWYDADVIDLSVAFWKPSGDSIESYWKQETPWFCGDFSRKTRVYTERMGGNSLDNFSWIYVNTTPAIPNNISLDTNIIERNSIVLFKDDEFHKSLVYHRFKDDYFHRFTDYFKIDNTQTHVRDPYDYNKYRLRGYNRIIGDFPSFSNGKPLTDEIRRICFFRKEFDFWWTEKVYDGAEDMGFKLSFEKDSSGNFIEEPPTITIPSDWYIKEMIVYYDWDTSVDKSIMKSLLLDKNRDISFYLKESDVSIDNLIFGRLPLTSGSEPVIGEDNSFKIDFAYYAGEKINFYGKIWKYVKIKKIELRLTSPTSNPNNNEGLDIDDYKVKSGQSAIVNDELGKMLAFHANERTGNIDVAVTYDNGKEWVVHKSIIRLLAGETASLPFAIKGVEGYIIHLFYVLNDSFLMYKKINNYDLELNDSLIEQSTPETYNLGDYDQNASEPESDYWGDFSIGGHNIRRSPSYFIAGNGEDEYFIEQLRITDDLRDDFENIEDRSKHQTPRFIYDGQISQMQDKFQGTIYAVHQDGPGKIRVFITVENLLSIKSSNDFRIWEYDIKDVEIHRDWSDPEVNKGEIIEIRNIQVLRNDFDSNAISLFYFHKDMLFVRHFSASLLNPVYDSAGRKVDSYLRNNLELSANSRNKPIFLVGKIPEEIKNKMIEEINNRTPLAESELFIDYDYSVDEISRFDEKFDVDMDTQIFAMADSQGLIRVLYKSKLGFLSSLILDARKIAFPEVWYDSKEKV